MSVRVLVLFILLLLTPCAALELTEQEQAYLRENNPVRVCVDPDWIPFEYIDGAGKHEGIAADLLRLAAERVGVELVLMPTKSWPESLRFSREGRCQLLSFLNQTPEREQWLIFTEPIFTQANVLISRADQPYIVDLSGLVDKTIALPRDTARDEYMRRHFPNLRLISADSEKIALDMVFNGEADLTIRPLIGAAYELRRGEYLSLKIAGQLPDFVNQYRIGVLRGEPILRDLLNKGIQTITPQERGTIIHKHVALGVPKRIEFDLFIKIVLGFLAVIALGVYRHVRLKAYNRELEKLSQTDVLTELRNRMKIEELFRQEIERAARYDRPFSIIMLDIDYFKRINDELGHQVGDRVLVAVARNITMSVRNTDFIGRWGGEEFLVLCPETTMEDGTVVAERICATIRADIYASGRSHSISGGVAQFSPGEDVDALLLRADTALYEAKRTGRDRICVSPTPPPQSPPPPTYPSVLHADTVRRDRPISIYVRR